MSLCLGSNIFTRCCTADVPMDREQAEDTRKDEGENSAHFSKSYTISFSNIPL